MKGQSARETPDRLRNVKIHYLINGLNGGGASFPIPDVVGVMESCGHEVKVVALMPQDLGGVPRLQRAGIPFEIIGRTRYDYLNQARQLVRVLRRDRPALLWTSLTRGTLYGQLAGRALGIPVVSWQHSAYLKPGNLALLRRTLALTARWVVDSESVRNFTQNRLGVAADKIDVWPLFSAHADAQQATEWTQGRFRIGTLGRLHPSKQYDVLLRAFARLRELDPQLFPQLQLVIGGNGPDEAMLKSLATSLKLDGHVEFAGFVEPGPFLASLHAYAQTSLKEGLCIAAHEAMQAGLAIVSTRVGELAYSVVPGETGWLCEVGDVEALAQALLELARNPETTAAMGRASRRRVLSRFDAEKSAAAGRAIMARVGREMAGA